MTTRKSFFTTAALAGTLAMSPVFSADAEAEPPEESWGTQVVTQGNNALAIDMYRQLVAGGEADDNVFFSPLSISAALSLTYEGARGETLSEFEHVLGIPTDTPDGPASDWGRPQYHEAMGGVLNTLDGEGKPYELSVANALWGEQSMPFRPQFVDTLNANYDAGLELVDFKAQPERQRERINDWVATRTHDRIQDLMPEDSVDGLTRLVLVNAIYFKAEWSNQFYEGATRDEDFYRSADDAVQIPMMRHGQERFSFGDFDGYDALALPYKGRDLSMVALLPDEHDGLAALEEQLSPELIEQTIAGMAHQSCNVWLPKWEATLDYDLIPALKELGMERAFDPQRADFTGLSESAEAEGICITGAFHKAFIAVDENGTEAAAATGIAAGLASAAPPQEVFDFRADHPFIYLIRDNRTGAILFMGRVTDPS